MGAAAHTFVVGVALIGFSVPSCRRPVESSPGAVAPPPRIANSESAETPTVASIRFVGRFEKVEPGAFRFAWPGSGIHGRFHGKVLRVRLKDEGPNYFQIVIDGTPTGVIQTEPTKSDYVVAEDLPDGVHDVALYKRTEAIVGETVFLGFEPARSLLPPAPPYERRIEIIGDSISTGYGNEGPAAACPFHPSEENEYLTYGAIAARALNAEHVTIAWSGKTIRQMRAYFERTLPARADSVWGFTGAPPQLVVVNLGTNDFAIRDPGEANFVQRYVELVTRIRSVYPDAYVVGGLGPMLSDGYPPGRQNLTRARSHLKAVATKLKKAGETRFEILEWTEQKHADGLGCGFHPSIKTQRLMAERLVALAKERLGW